MTTERETTASEYMAGRFEFIRPLLQLARGDEVADETIEALGLDIDETRDDPYAPLNDMVLSIERSEVWKIDLGTGGPADYFECFVTREGRTPLIDRIVYHYITWGHHQIVEMEEDGEQDYEDAKQFCREVTGDFGDQS